MAAHYTLHIGSAGGGVTSTPNRGETWNVSGGSVPLECTVRALSCYPVDSHRILAGSDAGLFRSENNGFTYQLLDTPMGDLQIWSLTVDPHNQDILYAGTCPEAFRSTNGGKNWEKMSIPVEIPCPVGIPWTTNLIVDPRDSCTIWAGIEVGGVWKSLDRGDTWVQVSDLGDDPFHGDIHGMALRPGSNSQIYCSTPFGLSSSTDEGESWDLHEFPKFNENDSHSYCRGMILKADDPDVIFVGNGDTIPGTVGAIRRTKDGGSAWDTVSLPVVPNSLIYWLGTHIEVPNVIVAVSLGGFIYLSEDGGETWEKLAKEFDEIRSVMVTPN